MRLVSVVIPTHNRAALLWRAVESVLAQTCRDVEVLIVDDGSTDATTQVLAERARADTRVRVARHAERKGAQAARNTGIRAATGEWIAFLDSDDMWLPDSLELRLQQAMRTGAQVVHSECRVWEPGAGEPRLFGVPPMQGRVYGELLRRPGPVFPGLLVRKQALMRIGCLDEAIRSYQEWDTSIRLAQHDEFAYVGAPTFLYDRRNADSMSRNPLLEAMGYEQVFAKHRWPVLRYFGPRALASHYQTAAALYQAANNVPQANRCVRAAFLLWPFRPKTFLRRLQRFV